MNVQQAVQSRSPFNGFNLHRIENDSSRMNNSLHPGQLNPSTMPIAGVTSGSIGEESESLSRDRLVYLTTCLIGHPVEVQVMNGSVYSGIFHASNVDGDFGVVLKMAHVIKDVSARGKSAASDSMRKTVIIPAYELVQVLAKDVPSDEQSNELQGGKRQDIMLDSCIFESHHVELERVLQPWMPDEDDPQCPELENIFDSPWTGSWDQFKVNETLFGVKSTFNEELYTTKLERGPQTRKLEEEALRIVREIEGEETYDLHLAEERGIHPYGNIDVDEETKYSSVNRGIDDNGYAYEDVILNSYAPKKHAGLAFGRSFADVTSGKNMRGCEDGEAPSGSLSKDELKLVQINTNCELHHSGSLTSSHNTAGVCGFADANRFQEIHVGARGNACIEKNVNEDVQSGKGDDSQSLWVAKRDSSEIASVSSMAAKGEQKTSFGELSEDLSGKVHVTAELADPQGRSGSSTSSSTKASGAATLIPRFPPVSPTLSVGSSSSEKSTLNPNAKEFKLNPNAESFMPSQSSLRPMFPVNDGSFYYPATMSAVPHMQGMPVGMGAAAMQSPQAYFPANGPQYGQPMILGHPGPVMFMPGYPSN